MKNREIKEIEEKIDALEIAKLPFILHSLLFEMQKIELKNKLEKLKREADRNE